MKHSLRPVAAAGVVTGGAQSDTACRDRVVIEGHNMTRHARTGALVAACGMRAICVVVCLYSPVSWKHYQRGLFEEHD